jgi:hypothetical protein
MQRYETIIPSNDRALVLNIDQAKRFFLAWQANTAPAPEFNVVDSHASNSVLDIDQANSFFLAWEANTAPEPEFSVREWGVFFQYWNQFKQSLDDSQFPPDFTYDELSGFAGVFDELFSTIVRQGGLTNVWRAAGVGCDELRNCEVLRWLFDKFGDHGQGSAILECLLEQVGGVVTAKHASESNYWTRVESFLLSDFESRVDIEIESPAFVIFIEAKIAASETNDQLMRYCNIAQIKAANLPWMVMFLTLDGRKPQDERLHKLVVPISWKQIAGILEKHTINHPLSELPNQLFRQFAKHIRDLYQ